MKTSRSTSQFHHSVLHLVHQEWRLIVLAALVVFCTSGAYSSVNVYPTEIFVAPPHHSSPVTVTNPTDSVLELWVTFVYGYPVAYDTGKVVMYQSDSVAASEPSCVGWLRAIPQRFTLRPQESQVVRLYGVPPPGTSSGEYWARVVVSSKPKNARVVTTQQTRIMMELVTQTSVPVHFRIGNISSGIQVKQASALLDNGFLKLHVKMARTGNASFWGRIGYKLLSASGKAIRTKDFRIVVYKEMDYSVIDSLPGVYAGPYSVELLFDNKHPSVTAQYRINSEPFLQRIPVTVR